MVFPAYLRPATGQQNHSLNRPKALSGFPRIYIFILQPHGPAVSIARRLSVVFPGLLDESGELRDELSQSPEGSQWFSQIATNSEGMATAHFLSQSPEGSQWFSQGEVRRGPENISKNGVSIARRLSVVFPDYPLVWRNMCSCTSQSPEGSQWFSQLGVQLGI